MLPQSHPPVGAAEFFASHRDPTKNDGTALLREALCQLAGRIAVVSSYGAQSAVLLAQVAEFAPATPVLFIDTGKLFSETLQYQRELTDYLGLQDVRTLHPSAAALDSRDPQGHLHHFDTDACCALRKVEPLAEGLAPFTVWVSGRRRVQSATRAAMPLLESADGRLKINPLANWTDAQIEAEMRRRSLPRHKLVARGYPSIGCAPCTRAVTAGDHPRSGRWAGLAKTECGIHRVRVSAES